MKILTTRVIEAPAAVVWELLGERFGDVADWASAIETSSLDRPLAQGAVRTCDLKAFGPVPPGQITEELTAFDRSARSFTFVVRSGMPGFMRRVQNTYAVEVLGPHRSQVTSRAVFEVAWWMMPVTPMLRVQLGRGIRGFLDELDAQLPPAAVRAA